MITARHKVLAYLKKNRAVSAREIARALDMSIPTIRYHLSVLKSDGRVDVAKARQHEGRGRPEKMYSLSRAVLGDNLPALANALLIQRGASVQMETVAEYILDAGDFTGLSAPKRLALMVERLNQMCYQAHWEAGAEGPRVVFGLCPYAKVIDAHPELCKLDAAILKGALGARIEQLAKIDQVHSACIFVVR